MSGARSHSSATKCANSKTDVAFPVHTLNTADPSRMWSIEASRAWTTSVTNTKSRVCEPSPNTSTGNPAWIRLQKIEMTPEYGDVGSCRGPYTLKNRSPTVGTPNSCDATCA